MAAADHVLHIRLEFEEAATALKEEAQKTTKSVLGIRDAWTEAGKVANKSGEAMLDAMTQLRAAMRNFDLTHPFRSLMDIAGAAANVIRTRFGIIGKVLVGIIGLMTSSFVNLISQQERLVNTFAQLSAFATNTAGELERLSMGDRVQRALDDIGEVAMRTTASLEEVTQVYSQLALIRVPTQDLERLSELTVIAGRAMGMNTDRMAQFIGHLRVIGGVGVSNIESVAETFAAVQDAVGLTNEELTNVMDTVEKLTLQIQGLGATSEQITTMAEETARLAGLFGELGLQAQRGTEMMQNLMDPSRTRENLFLMNQMGLSFQEMQAMQAGMMEEGQVTEGLVNAAQRFQQMTAGMVPAQAARIAELFGMPMQELNRLANNADEVLARINSAEARAQEALQERAAEGMSQLNKSFGRMMNVIQAMFAGPLSRVIGYLTDKLESLNDWWLANSDAIENNLNNAIDSFINWVMKLDFGKIKDFFVSLKEWAVKIWENFKTIAKWAGIAVAAFLGLRVIGTLMPLLQGVGGLIGGIANKIRGLAGAASGTGSTLASFGQAAGAGLGVFLKMAGVATIMIGIAFAMDMLAGALQKFADVKWGDMAKAAATLGVLVGAMAGMAAAFSNPVMMAGLAVAAAGMMGIALAIKMLGEGIQAIGNGMALFAEGIGNLVTNLTGLSENASVIKDGLEDVAPVIRQFAEAMQPLAAALEETGPRVAEVSGALLNMVEAVNALSPENIAMISESVTDETVTAFRSLGQALSEMAMSFQLMDPRSMENKGNAIKAIGEGLKDLAVATWVLDQTSNMDQAVSGIAQLADAIMGMFAGKITVVIGNMERLGAGFTNMTEGIVRLTEIDSTAISELGPAMENSARGLSQWMRAFRRGGKLFGDMEELGDGFRQLAVGIWVLGETDFEDLAVNMAEFTPTLIEMLEAISDNTRVFGDSRKLSEAFGMVTESIMEFAELPANDLTRVTDAVKDMGPHVADWLRAIGEASGTFFRDVIKAAEAFEIVTQAISAMAGTGNLMQTAQAISVMGQSVGDWLRAIGEASGTFFRDVIRVGEAFRTVTEGISSMAASGDITSTAEGINTMRVAVVDWITALGENASILRDVEAVGESFKGLAEGISAMATARSEAGGFGNMGAEMEQMTVGIAEWIRAMKEEGGQFEVLGLGFGRSIEEVGSQFGMLGGSIASLTNPETIEGMRALGSNATIMNNMSSAIARMMNTVREAADIGGRGEQFQQLAEAIRTLSIIGPAGETGMNAVARGIRQVGQALDIHSGMFTGRNSAADEFIDFINRVQRAGPIRLDAEAMTEGTVRTRVETEGLDETTSMTVSIQSAVQGAAQLVVAAVDRLNNAEATRHNERLEVLASIATNTRRAQRAAERS